MKIGIQTWGTNGDIRPMIALADSLQKAGHTVTLAVTSIDNHSYAQICQQLGICYLQIPEQINVDNESFFQKSADMYMPHFFKLLLDEAFFPFEQDIYRVSQKLARDNDCLIGHAVLYPLKLAARKQAKPFVSVTFCHAGYLVPAQPPFRFPDFHPLFYRLEWELFYYFFDWVLKKRMTRLWLAEGQARVGHLLTDYLISDQLNLVAVDPLFCPDQSRWPAVNRICGFLNLPEEAQNWQLPFTLENFINQGEAPVYMTFGSLQALVAEESMELFISAVHKAGCRAIIQTSSEKYPPDSQQDNIYFIGKHPHQPVFKHCAAVVHHGGAGTTHTTILSGCPSVVVPFMDEQLFWGRQLRKLGISGSPLTIKKVNADTLAIRIRAVLRSKTMHAQVQTYRQQMQPDLSQAVRLIEAQMQAVDS